MQCEKPTIKGCINMDIYNRIFGCIAGAAVGNAMGAVTETCSAEMIHRDFGGLGERHPATTG